MDTARIRYLAAAIFCRILSGLSWIYIFILLFWVYHLKDPHLLIFRNYETALIIALWVVGFFI